MQLKLYCVGSKWPFIRRRTGRARERGEQENVERRRTGRAGGESRRTGRIGEWGEQENGE
jgi:hypothetical protein